MTEFKLCDSRCGDKKEHCLFECEYSSAWEISDNGDGTYLDWIHKVCLECMGPRIHVLESDGSSLQCSGCGAISLISSLYHLAYPQKLKLALAVNYTYVEDDNQRSFMANRLGDRLMKDAIIKIKTKNMRKYAADIYVKYHIHHSYFLSKCSVEEKRYKFEFYIVPNSAVDIIYSVPEGIEKKLEQRNREEMYDNDIKGNVKFSTEEDFSVPVACVNLADISAYEDFTQLGMWIKMENKKWIPLPTPSKSFQNQYAAASPVNASANSLSKKIKIRV